LFQAEESCKSAAAGEVGLDKGSDVVVLTKEAIQNPTKAPQYT
jgi:hypothetical protein